MLTVVGLGNPGASYRNTRHNVGFMVLDLMAEGGFGGEAVYRRSGSWIFRGVFGKTGRFRKSSGLYEVLKGGIAGKSFLLVKPATFMNESGSAVSSLITQRKVRDLSEILVVVDDIDLELGRLRIRERGASGGHNGLKSIIEALGSEEFARLRIGIGPRPNGTETVEYVLAPFSPEERKIIEKTLLVAARCVEAWIIGGIAHARKELPNVP